MTHLPKRVKVNPTKRDEQSIRITKLVDLTATCKNSLYCVISDIDRFDSLVFVSLEFSGLFDDKSAVDRFKLKKEGKWQRSTGERGA